MTHDASGTEAEAVTPAEFFEAQLWRYYPGFITEYPDAPQHYGQLGPAQREIVWDLFCELWRPQGPQDSLQMILRLLTRIGTASLRLIEDEYPFVWVEVTETNRHRVNSGTGWCTCLSYRRNRICYHNAAVLILDAADGDYQPSTPNLAKGA